MSDKDLVKEAALKALARPTVKNPPIGGAVSTTKSTGQTPKTTKLPEKGSAEAHAHKQAAIEANANKAKSKPPLPEKGSAEANVHKQATIEASDNKSKSKPPLPEKGSAEAQVHKQAAIAASSIRLSEPERLVPEKGGAEAQVHKLAAEEAAKKGTNPTQKTNKQDKRGSGAGFLFLVLALPLAVVGGIYGYAHMQENAKKSSKGSLSIATSPKSQTPSSAFAKRGLQNPLMTKSRTDHRKTKPAVAGAKAVKTAVTMPATTGTKTGASAHQVHWDYKSTNWAALDPSFKLCAKGRAQSPVNIVAGNQQTGPGFSYNYFSTNGKVHNNGHSIQVDLNKPASGMSNQLLVNGQAYDLVQFHFHTPSEHHINGRPYPMEVHLVHKNAQGQLAVVAVMIIAGPPNQLIDQMPLPAAKGQFSQSGGAYINPILLLPNDRRSHTFTGSLTTPPCTQNVGWIVMKKPITISLATLTKFQKILGKNNRPIQPTNGRTIYSGN